MGQSTYSHSPSSSATPHWPLTLYPWLPSVGRKKLLMSRDIRIWQGGWFVSWEMARLAMNRYGEECSSRTQEPPLVSLLPENLPKTERARRKGVHLWFCLSKKPKETHAYRARICIQASTHTHKAKRNLLKGNEISGEHCKSHWFSVITGG